MKRYVSAIVIAIGVFGGTATGLWLSGRGSVVDLFRSKPSLTLKNAVPGAADPYIKGNTSAPVTIEEFADFQCGPCRHMHSELVKVEAQYGDRLRMIFRHYPLEDIHPNAIAASRAAESAGRQGKFWEMHDMLYEKQSEWEDADNPVDKFKSYAATLNLDTAKFVADMNNANVDQRVSIDKKRGDSAGVEGTPTLFINGTALTDDDATPEGIRKAIDTAMRQ
jgi:protein-disulfide isomerase